MKSIFMLIFYFSNSFCYENNEEELFQVFISRQNWHTGIIIKTELIKNYSDKYFPHINEFEWIDIGWGDEEFYQYPGFNIDLAVQALFVNTPSVIRIEGIKLSIENYLSYTDSFIKIEFNYIELQKFIKFIFNSLRIEDEKPKLVSSRGEKIFYYSSELKYNAFYTCNTWVAEGLNVSEFSINPFLILTSQKLFTEIKRGLSRRCVNLQSDNSNNN